MEKGKIKGNDLTKGKKLILTELSNLVIMDELVDLFDTECALEELQESIFSKGLICPISVVGPDKNGKYIAISGMRRINALKEISESDASIPCYVLKKTMEKGDIIQIAMDSNTTKRDENINALRLRYCNLLLERADAGEFSKAKVSSKLADLAGVTQRTARAVRNLCEKGTPVITESFINHEISVMEAEEVVNTFPNSKKDQADCLRKYRLVGKKGRDVMHSVISQKAESTIEYEVSQARKHIQNILTSGEILHKAEVSGLKELCTECLDMLRIVS